MANDLLIQEGIGPKKVHTDEIGSDLHVEVVKIDFGAPGQLAPVGIGVNGLPVQNNIRSAANFGNQFVDTGTGTTIRAATGSRTQLHLKNTGPDTIYLGTISTVTDVTGYPLALGEVFKLDGYTGNVFGYVPSGTANIRYWEIR